MLWNILPQLLAFLMVVLAAILDYVWHDKRTRKFRIARLSLFILVLAGLVTSVAVAIRSDRSHEAEVRRHQAEVLRNEAKVRDLTILLDKLRTQGELHGNTTSRKMQLMLEAQKSLRSALSPFEELAKKRYPDLPVQSALNRLFADVSALQSRTTLLEHQTKKTVFRVSSQSKERLADGTYECKFVLTPVGRNVVSLLTIECQTENKTAISDLKVEGPTVPPMSYDRTAKDQTTCRKEFRGLYPGIINVTIRTAGDPGRLRLGVDPLQKP